jgi:16S rRNA (uracil1498-N3)-methyltransferase
MGSSNLLPLRALPRCFLEIDPLSTEPIELPAAEYDKFRKVLRLEKGDHVAILPNDGSIIRCEYLGKAVAPLERTLLQTESLTKVTLIQALPKMEKLETIVRMCTELGVSNFVLFPSDRTVVRWEPKKLKDRIHRLETIIKESAEVSCRGILPTITYIQNLDAVLSQYPNAAALSEYENVTKHLNLNGSSCEIIVGPEGGWAPREVSKVADRSVTLGPRVLRVETAAVASCSYLLLQSSASR